MRVMIVVTHLLGTGHLVRAATLARAFAASGHETRVLSGGMPVPHLNCDGFALIQLPPLRSDGVNFTRMLDADGNEASESYLSRRMDQMVAEVQDFAPDVLLTELFPFGRRSLRSEFDAVLRAAHALDPRPIICASIRDILAPPSKPSKVTFAEEMLETYYDRVLVHSDEAVVPLGTSWPVSPALQDKLSYTGFVAPAAPQPHPAALGDGEILVSAGGGDVGDRIYECVLDLAQTSPRRFRLLVGGPDARRARFAQSAPATVTIEAPRPDFRNMLLHAAASVSMCGYNTALDLLQTGVPSVIVPFDDGSEVEQSLRAEALGRLPGFDVLKSADLTADHLMRAIERVLNGPKRPIVSDGMAGAVESVRSVEAFARAQGRPA